MNGRAGDVVIAEGPMLDLEGAGARSRKWACLSEDGLYRYELGRLWGLEQHEGGRRICWVMLNPSTADHEVDDPTIRRCIGFSKAWGYDELVVVNVYAYRATQPSALGEAVGAGIDIAGPFNDEYVLSNCYGANKVVAAWGADHSATERAERAFAHFRPFMCLGTTKDGHPRHPLYVRGDQELEVWRA